MISWDHWQTLLTIFRSGTYSKAAQALNIDPTTIGRRLKLLERRLGYSLFLRHDGRLYPTNQCEQLLAHLENAYEALRLAEQSSADSDIGAIWRVIRMSAPLFIVKGIYASSVLALSKEQRVQMELIGTGSNLDLTRREADIAVRIDDHPNSIKVDAENIEAEKIATLSYAVYHRKDTTPEALPWAGLVDTYVRTSGIDVTHKLVGSSGLQFRVSHFDALREIIASGAARGLLPCFSADSDALMVRTGEIALKQSLWMLYHRQDRDVPHLQAARNWVVEQAQSQLHAV